jgi:HEPN domain-containing protein
MKETEREAKRWFLQADDDRRFVEWVLKEGVFFDKGCFLAQQAGEKAVNACLYASGKRRIIGHSIFEMISELIGHEKAFEEIQGPAKRLDRFYITTRYPNGLPGGSPFQLYTLEDLASAHRDLSKIFNVSVRYLIKIGVIVEGK